MATAPETYRRAQAALSSRAAADLRKVWPRLLTMSPDRTAEALALVLAEVTDKYGSASAALAAEWFEELRAASGATGSLTAQAAALPSTERLEILARWGVGPLFGATPASATALSLVTGGLSRQVLSVGRETLMQSIATDPAGPRYARHASANACAFCAMLATRGPVYASKASAGTVTGENLGGTDYRKARRLDGTVTPERRAEILRGTRARTIEQGGRKGRDTTQDLGEKYHDDCHCTVVPVWSADQYREAPYVEKWREAYAEAHDGGMTTKETLSGLRQALGSN